jgi:hypothetical protein
MTAAGIESESSLSRRIPRIGHLEFHFWSAPPTSAHHTFLEHPVSSSHAPDPNLTGTGFDSPTHRHLALWSGVQFSAFQPSPSTQPTMSTPGDAAVPPAFADDGQERGGLVCGSDARASFRRGRLTSLSARTSLSPTMAKATLMRSPETTKGRCVTSTLMISLPRVGRSDVRYPDEVRSGARKER